MENSELRKVNSDYPRKVSRKPSSIKVTSSVPRNKSEFLRWYGWGYKDSGIVRENGVIKFIGDRYEISGKELPHLTSYLKEKYDITFEEDRKSTVINLPEINHYPISKFCEKIINEIKDLGIEVSIEGVHRFTRSEGQSYDEVMKIREKDLTRIPDAVAWPTCHEEVEQLVKLANKINFCIIPYGGGTSVARAIECPADEMRPILILDTNAMNEILWVDRENMMVCAESGIIGQDLERELNKIGYTTGHEPDSNEFSTLGGWVSTRASGMKKNIYGNIEDLMIHAKIVTSSGVLDKYSKTPRMSCGPDFNHIILGSEGILGVITEVVIKIRPLPECQLFESIVFPDFKTGTKFMNEIALRRWQPASIRLMDEEQFQIGWALRPKSSIITSLIDTIKFSYLSKIRGFDLKKICLCTIVHEGLRKEVSERIKSIMKLAEDMGGVPSGATVGKRGYMMTFVVAYMRDIAIDIDIVAESMETTLPWNTVYEASVAVRETVTEEAVRLGALKSLCMMRIAQTYDTACCLYIYFSFTVLPNADRIAMCTQMNTKIKHLCLQYGGSLSHHHGVGKLKKALYQQFISSPAVDAMRSIKKRLDPNNIFAARNFLDDFYSENNELKSKL